MWSYPFFQHAFEAGTIVAVVAGVIGYFVVLRRVAFAAHALSHIGFAGAAGAVALSINPLWGLLVFCVSSGAVIGALGQRLRSRDTVIGIVLAFSLGLGALFLSLYHGGDANAAVSILFGEILGVSAGDVLLTLGVGAVALLVVAAVYRPLLFASVDEDVAEARGIPVRLLSVAFMVTLALAVAVAVQVVGVLLIFALLVAPAAMAERLTSSPPRAVGALGRHRPRVHLVGTGHQLVLELSRQLLHRDHRHRRLRPLPGGAGRRAPAAVERPGGCGRSTVTSAGPSLGSVGRARSGRTVEPHR